MRITALAAACLALLLLAGCDSGDDATPAEVAAPAPAAEAVPAPAVPAATPADPAVTPPPVPPAVTAPAAPEVVPPVAAETPPAPVAPAETPAATPPVEPVPATPPTPEPTPPAAAPAEATPIVPAAPEAVPPAAATPAAPTPPPAPATPAAPGQAAAPPVLVPGLDPTLFARLETADATGGQIAAGRCLVCHTVGEGEAAGIGPNLYDIVGAPIGRDPTFAYSAAFRTQNAVGANWTFDRLDAFLRDPAAAIPGTLMTFPGIDNEAIRAGVIAYLRSLSANPAPLTVADAAPVPVFDPTAAYFTTAQAEAGALAYRRLGCAECHGENLGGQIDMREGGIGNPPALVAANFTNRWRDRTLGEFFDLLRETKPLEAPGALPAETYAELVAFILSRNGFVAGDRVLPADPAILAGLQFHQ